MSASSESHTEIGQAATSVSTWNGTSTASAASVWWITASAARRRSHH
ncbi:hypothetical protein [Actinokineospora inagensis]|nr:hypothetical protein [Actinokineospora inagensis]